MVTDYIMTFVAFLIFNVYRYFALSEIGAIGGDLWSFMTDAKIEFEQIFVPLCLMLVYLLSGYYNNPFSKSRLSEFLSTLVSAVVSSLLIFLALLINDSFGVRRIGYLMILSSFLLLFFCTYLGRWSWTSITISHLKRREWIYSILIVGNSKSSRQTYKKLKESGSVWSYDVAGFIRIPGEKDVEDEMPVWDFAEIKDVCEQHSIDQIILSPNTRNDNVIMRLLDKLFPLDIPVKIAPNTLSYVTSHIQLNDILGVPLVDLTSPRMSDCETNIKRAIDIVVSIIALIILSPVMLWASIMVKLSSPGPVIYSQVRMGKKQKPFRIYKFRSMREDAESEGPRLSHSKDDRITKFGHFMRKYRIDEFPQFWNVLKGDMSLVGPRPEREYYIRQIMKEAPYYGLVFQIRPGITSWGMVKYGYASNIKQMVKRSRYDLVYINNMSLTTDLKILIYTVRTVIKGAGV